MHSWPQCKSGGNSINCKAAALVGRDFKPASYSYNRVLNKGKLY